ncbi:MAG TPA: toluene hydroxylase [Polyangia bacterium]|jgi:toluene monooxygenase system protein E|nr:toluene hydroxylase [Polyangia bacterium]
MARLAGSPLKTYAHLADLPRKPSRYDIATSALDYRGSRPFAVNVPLGDWYRRHQQESPLATADWATFADPRQTDYTAYVRLQQAQEAHVDGVLRSMEESHYDQDQPAAAHALLERALTPLRYVFHGFQMVAAYVGQMAPVSRITIAALLQAADETRRIQRIAYRMAQVRLQRPSFGDGSLAAWQEDPTWQPLRELVERLLVAYDWGEAFVALNVCAKPLLDDLFMVQLPLLAKERGDFLLGQIASSLNRDCDWHRQWTASLLAVALRASPANRAAVERWREIWWPRALLAAEALVPLLGDGGAALVAASRERALGFIDRLELRPTS